MDGVEFNKKIEQLNKDIKSCNDMVAAYQLMFKTQQSIIKKLKKDSKKQDDMISELTQVTLSYEKYVRNIKKQSLN